MIRILFLIGLVYPMMALSGNPASSESRGTMSTDTIWIRKVSESFTVTIEKDTVMFTTDDWLQVKAKSTKNPVYRGKILSKESIISPTKDFADLLHYSTRRPASNRDSIAVKNCYFLNNLKDSACVLVFKFESDTVYEGKIVNEKANKISNDLKGRADSLVLSSTEFSAIGITESDTSTVYSLRFVRSGLLSVEYISKIGIVTIEKDIVIPPPTPTPTPWQEFMRFVHDHYVLLIIIILIISFGIIEWCRVKKGKGILFFLFAIFKSSIDKITLIGTLTAEYEKILSALKDRHASEIQKHLDEEARLKKDKETAIADLNSEHEKKVTELNNKHASEIQEHLGEEARLKKDKETAIADLNSEHEKKVTELNNKHASEIQEHLGEEARLKKDKETAIADLKSEHENEVTELNDRHASEIQKHLYEEARLQKDKETAIADLKSEHEKKVTELNNKHASEIQEHLGEEARLKKDKETAIADLNSEHEKKVTELNSRHASEIQEHLDEEARLKKDKETAIADMKSKCDAEISGITRFFEIKQQRIDNSFTSVEYAQSYASTIAELMMLHNNITNSAYSIGLMPIRDKYHLYKAFFNHYQAIYQRIDMAQFCYDVKIISETGFAARNIAMSNIKTDNSNNVNDSMIQYFANNYLESYVSSIVVLVESMAGIHRLIPEIQAEQTHVFDEYRKDLLDICSRLQLEIATVHLFDSIYKNVDLDVTLVNGGDFESGAILGINNCYVYIRGGKRPEWKISVIAQE